MDILKRKRKPRQVNKASDFGSPPRPPREEPLGSGEIPKKRRGKAKKIFLVFIIVFLVIAAVAGAGYAYVKATKLRGESAGRVNFMFLGVDSAASLSDTIMIVSLDTRQNRSPKLAIISLPRDLLVDIPELGTAKINAAYSNGLNSDHPGGGAGLSADTLEENFGQTIHYYAVLNFEGFEKIVDTVGGVEVNIESDLYDPEYPLPGYTGIETFELAAGKHKLNGELALKVARCRKGTCGNDYGRAARQQQIILALRQKLLSSQTLLNYGRLSGIRNTLTKNLDTDLELRQMAKLAWLLRDLGESDITRHVIDTSNFLVSADGGSNLAPRSGDFTEINQFIKNIFTQTGDTLPEAN